VMPFLSIFLIVVGGQAIGMRSMCIYELGTDYVKYAKLLGIKENKILLYVFRNAMLPQLTGLALALGAMVGGALITEIIFSYPGLGMAILTAIQGNDYPVITGCTLLIAACVLAANFSVDILIGFLDPRIRAAQASSK
jgi:peptide/nickel transport system permease protein